MTPTFSWHIPCGGDGRWMCQREPERPPHAAYLTSIAQAAEESGFDSVLVPAAFSNGNHGIDAPYVDSYTIGVACLAATSRIQVLIAHRPGFVNPGVFAQMCATADDLGTGRLALNVVTAGAPGDMEQFGDREDHAGRYRRAGEYLDVLKRLWTEPLIDHDGEFYTLTGARSFPKPVRPGGPPIYLVGASEDALSLAARHADVYLMSAEPVDAIAERITGLRRRTPGRRLRFGVAATIFAASTGEEAREWARTFAAHADLDVVAERAALGRTTTSVEDLRARAGTNIDSWLGPNLWRGIAHLTHGAALVGSYDELAALFARYAEAGVSFFQMYGYPYLEEARHLGEHLLPRIRAALAQRAP